MEGAVRSGRATAARVVTWLKGGDAEAGRRGTEGPHQWSPHEAIVEGNGISRWIVVIGMAVAAFVFRNKIIQLALFLARGETRSRSLRLS